MPIITISREYGAGGLVAGRRVAEILNAEFLDSALIEEVAKRLHLPEDAVKRWDERREGLVLRLLRSLQAAHPEYAAGGPLTVEAFDEAPDPERIGRLFREVICEEARSGNAVIVGRGGVFALRDWPGACHIRLVAPAEARRKRIMDRTGMSAEEAQKRLEDADRERGGYIRHYFGEDVHDPSHYAVVINTEVLGIERTARLIVEIAGGRIE